MNQAVLASSAPSYRMRQPPGAVSDGHVLNTEESRSAGAFGAVGNSLRGSEAFSQDHGKALLGSRVHDLASPYSANLPPRNAYAGAEQLVELCASKGPLIHCLTIGRAYKLADPVFDVLVQCTNLQVLNVPRTAAFRGADGGPGGKLLAKILTFCP